MDILAEMLKNSLIGGKGLIFEVVVCRHKYACTVSVNAFSLYISCRGRLARYAFSE